jgi:hypothetical protein
LLRASIIGIVSDATLFKPDQTHDNGEAVPSPENERIYTTDMVNAVKGGQLGSTFLFEAFDEPWKHDSHWGLWDQNGNPKFAIPSGL